MVFPVVSNATKHPWMCIFADSRGISRGTLSIRGVVLGEMRIGEIACTKAMHTSHFKRCSPTTSLFSTYAKIGTIQRRFARMTSKFVKCSLCFENKLMAIREDGA